MNEYGISPLMAAIITSKKRNQKRIKRLCVFGGILAAVGCFASVYFGLEINFGCRIPYGLAGTASIVSFLMMVGGLSILSKNYGRM